MSPIENRSILNGSFEEKYKKTVPYSSQSVYAKHSNYAEENYEKKGRKTSIKDNNSEYGHKNLNKFSRGESSK
jgi:hypothetical protein